MVKDSDGLPLTRRPRRAGEACYSPRARYAPPPPLSIEASVSLASSGGKRNPSDPVRREGVQGLPIRPHSRCLGYSFGHPYSSFFPLGRSALCFGPLAPPRSCKGSWVKFEGQLRVHNLLEGTGYLGETTFRFTGSFIMAGV